MKTKIQVYEQTSQVHGTKGPSFQRAELGLDSSPEAAGAGRGSSVPLLQGGGPPPCPVLGIPGNGFLLADIGEQGAAGRRRGARCGKQANARLGALEGRPSAAASSAYGRLIAGQGGRLFTC